MKFEFPADWLELCTGCKLLRLIEWGREHNSVVTIYAQHDNSIPLQFYVHPREVKFPEPEWKRGLFGFPVPQTDVPPEFTRLYWVFSVNSVTLECSCKEKSAWAKAGESVQTMAK